MNDDSVLRDALWKLYQEHCTHVRHHESQRASAASSFLVIAGALLGLVTYDKSIGLADLPLTILLLLLGSFGALFSAKHYERASLHTERARRFRDAVDATLPGQPLKMFKATADAAHSKDFPKLEKLRLNKFWVGLYLMVAGLGLMLSVMAIWFPQTEATAKPLIAHEPSKVGAAITPRKQHSPGQ